jgi:hypothetical protein
MFKKIFTIVVPVLAITAAILLFGIKVYNDSYSEFQEDGYIIGTVDGKESNKHYFNKENLYKINDTKGEVVFENTDQAEITIPDDAFVHYTDGSIATFKKAVVLNLTNVKNSTFQYYNVYPGSIFTKTSEGHQINYLDQKLAFGNFVIKVTDTKYMIVGRKLNVKYGEEEKNISEGFLEVTYLDGNIIKIENQDLQIQNISKDLSVETDGIKVDLLNKKIIYDGETKLNLGEITIDSDDNIEIIPDEENTEIDEEASNSLDYYEDQPITAPNVNIGGMQSGVVDTSTKRPDEVVEENAKIKDAEFSVVGIDPTVSSVNVRIDIVDDQDTLRGGISWKIVENATNQIMCKQDNITGTFQLSFGCTNLAPETNYSVIVRSAYEKNDVMYEKDFVQKTFVTKSMGVTIEQDFVKTDEIGFVVNINGTSNITKFYYDLIGPEGELEPNKEKFVEPPANTGTDVKVHLSFKTNDKYKIRSNTQYTLRVYGMVYGSEGLSNTYKLTKKLTTLKQKPKFGEHAVAINKQSSKFVLYLNNVTDPDNGVHSYRTDIYQANNVGDKKTIVTSRETSASSDIIIDVDGTVIEPYVNYRAKIYAIFYNNEMEYEIYLGYQDMNMNSEGGPVLAFESTEVTHERIKGTLTINDPNELLDLNRDFTIIAQNASIGHHTKSYSKKIDSNIIPNKKEFTIIIDDNDLKSNESYLYTIMAWIDYKDGNGYRNVDIGQFIVNTKEPTPLNAKIENKTKGSGVAFKIDFQLSASDELKQGDNPIEMRTMEKIVFRVRSESYDPKTQCNAINKCWEVPYIDSKDGVGEEYVSSLKADFFDKKASFTPTKMGIDDSQLSYGNYIFEVLSATDYTQYENVLPINNNVGTFIPNANPETAIQPTKFTDSPIYNNGSVVAKDDDLNTNTIIGYKVVPDIILPDTNKRENYQIEYTIHNLTTGESHIVTDSEIKKLYDPAVSDGNNAVALLFDNIPGDAKFQYKRGESYGLTYKITYDIGIEDEEPKTAEIADPMAFRIQPDKQVPTIDAYLSQRKFSGEQIWKFEINDVDEALVSNGADGISAKYNTSIDKNEKPVTCGAGYTTTRGCLENTNTEKTIMTNVSEGSVYIFTTAQLRKGAKESAYGLNDNNQTINFIDGVLFRTIGQYTQDTTYKLIKGANDVKYQLSDYAINILQDNVAKVKITLSAGGTSVVLFKDIDDVNNIGAIGAQISLDFSEVPELMGKGPITSKVELLWDRNVAGFDSTITDINADRQVGFVLQETANGSTTFLTKNGMNIFSSKTFDYKKSKLSLVDLNGNGYDITFNKSAKGPYYRTASGADAFINVKVLDSKVVECTAGQVCTFEFDSIKPTLYLEDKDITPFIGGVKVKPTFIVDSTIENELSLKVTLYEYNETAGTCSATVADSKTYKYSTEIKPDSNFKVERTELATDQSYCIQFTWLNAANEEKDFYFGSAYHNAVPTPPDRRTYIFKTLAGPTLKNPSVTYDLGTIKRGDEGYDEVPDSSRQHDDFNRSMTVAFDVDTIENYDGFVYEILDADKNVITTMSNLSLPTTEVESDSHFEFQFNIDANLEKQTILSNKQYYLNVIPYRDCNGGLTCGTDFKERLKPTEVPFSFYILDPVVKIQRFYNAQDATGELSFNVIVNDRHRAVGGYSLSENRRNAKYYVSVVNDKNVSVGLDTLETNYPEASKSYKKIAHCKNSAICKIIVKYDADVQNGGTFLSYTVEKEFSVQTSIDIGQSNIIDTSAAEIVLGFTDFFAITEVDTVDFTITDKNGKSITKTNYVAEWVPGDDDPENHSVYHLALEVALARGSYQLTVIYKDGVTMIASKTYTVVIK